MTQHALELRQAIDAVRARFVRVARLRMAAVVCLALAGTWGLARIAVWTLPGAGQTAALAAAAALAISAAVVAAAWLRRVAVPGDRALARFIEERCPSLEDRVATAVEVSARPDGAGSLAGALLSDAAASLRRVSIDEVIPGEQTRTVALRAATAATLLLAVALTWVSPGSRALHAMLLQLFPARYAIQVSPGHAKVRVRQSLVVRAETTAAKSGLVPELVVTLRGRSRSVPMQTDGTDRFAFTLEAVPASFSYHVAVGGLKSPTYEVRVLEDPRVRRIDLHYEFPAYTRLAPRDEADGGDIYAPAGTRVRFSVEPTKPVRQAALVLAGGRRVPLAAGPGGRLTGELAVSGDGAYRVALADHDGLETSGDTEYFIRVLDDRPPDVRILRPAGDRQVTPLEEVAVEARADDDYGLASFDLVYSVRGQAERAVPLTGTKSPLTVTGSRTLYLEDLGVSPGDFVSYYARARDIGRGKRSTEARSDIFFLEVRPFEEEFAAAQSQAMSGSGNRSLDDLVSAQKDIIVATWKLDRRSSAGTSVADVKAVARAQGELKKRAERAAGAMREPRRRFRVTPPAPPPAAPGGTAATDPMAAAAAAMGTAETALNAVKTKDALPAEMEALNHLLRAQAEVRRREVARQQASAGGGGGFNRAQQDLSTLFDRELQRQQQTNYETPQRATQEERRDQQDGALDKVRELARRQEALGRQQEELARSGQDLTPEERRRRLERLTREQSELRQQAEQLAQQLAREQQRGQQARQDASGQQGSPGQQEQPGQQPGRQGQSGASGQAAADALRRASEEMRGAASDLRRENAAQASARSSRALDRLRGLERQLQSGAPDERRRAIGDLQLEARQLADRQRQVAEEAARARTPRPGGADEGRRLAAEQDRLADRAGRLQDQLGSLQGGGQAEKDGQAVRDAARAMSEHQVAERMRQAAEGLRSGGGGARDRPERPAVDPAQAGQEAARALDRVADRLGQATGARGAEDARISEQLTRAREARERLAELERRIGDAQRRAEADARTQAAQAQGQSQAGSSSGRAGGRQPGSQGGPGAARELQQLRDEYAREVRQAAELQGALQRELGPGGAGTTPERQAMALSAPGTEAFKQDFSRWESLKKDVTLALERVEAALSQKALERAARERLRAGAADGAPRDYQDAVDRYFRSLAQPKP